MAWPILSMKHACSMAEQIMCHLQLPAIQMLAYITVTQAKWEQGPQMANVAMIEQKGSGVMSEMEILRFKLIKNLPLLSRLMAQLVH
jgi:hypothetical protein